MAETDNRGHGDGKPADPSVPLPAHPEGGELADAQLDTVSGGQAAESDGTSNVLKVRHDTAKNMIGNLR